ncbi:MULTISPECIES: GNAT family N-acetyltransferase [Bacillaceae]|uniref:GNAT family N-acetyltransferase n=1 Tax=Evansella alkalicola TaxID=745819 RepID=A0ABS6JXH8_9BACI|nr:MULTISPECIES: GNAT family N-acetyltransferase [Bacillaceae]MBU9722932.1 GNAT family N-acetyltransferase [Bacillus alkalicola]
MIRKLREKDREACLAFIKEQPAENLFINGDLEAFGFEEDFQEVWGDFDEDGQYRAVVLRYRKNYIIYAPSSSDFDSINVAKLIDQDNQTNKMVSGISSTVNEVIPHLTAKPKRKREMYYSKCESIQTLPLPSLPIKKATVKDAPRIVELYKQIPEFDANDDREEGLVKNMEAGVSRCYYIEDGEKIVSTAMTTAENSMSAMVMGVCTLDGYKKNGYASACLIQLCSELLKEGKYLCLFYDNPEAGTIYKRLGFEDIGKWVLNSY